MQDPVRETYSGMRLPRHALMQDHVRGTFGGMRFDTQDKTDDDDWSHRDFVEAYLEGLPVISIETNIYHNDTEDEDHNAEFEGNCTIVGTKLHSPKFTDKEEEESEEVRQY